MSQRSLARADQAEAEVRDVFSAFESRGDFRIRDWGGVSHGRGLALADLQKGRWLSGTQLR